MRPVRVRSRVRSPFFFPSSYVEKRRITGVPRAGFTGGAGSRRSSDRAVIATRARGLKSNFW